MTPEGIGRIEWLCEGGELKRGWGHMGYAEPSGVIAGATAGQFTDTYNAGEIGIIWLDYFYAFLDADLDVNAHTTQSASKVTQTRWISTAELWKFGQHRVSDIRAIDFVSDYAGFQSFLKFAVKKKRFVWWPDYETYPDEYYFCILEKYSKPQRVKNLPEFNLTFHVRVLPSVQYPSTVPSFI